MTTLPDYARNTLVLAHALARSTRFDDAPVMGPAGSRPDDIDARLAALRARNEELRREIAHLLSPSGVRP